MTTIELAVQNGCARIDLRQYGIAHQRGDHYWRVRWFEGGEEVDHIELFEDLAGMAQRARSDGGAAWRYYETDVFADAREYQAFLDSHGAEPNDAKR